MKGHRRYPVVHHYPYYGYGYPYNPYDYYWRRPEPEPPFIIIKDEDSDAKVGDNFFSKVNWPTVAAALGLNAILLMATRGGR